MRSLRGAHCTTFALAAVVFCAASVPLAAQTAPRVRARDLGVAPGIFRPGQHNAITDVAGVTVGHATILSGDSVHTGVTAIRPHDGNLYFQRVPAAVFVGNAFGKLVGATQVRELGELETPILLTCTLCIWRAADALKDAMLAQPGMERVVSINPVVGETNDGGLNPARPNAVTAATVRDALAATRGGPVAEGSVGAGAGTQAFSWKGGIGTSSRVLPASLGGWTVGVLVQSNFGGVLQVLGAPVGRALGSYAFKDAVDRDRGDGSIMIVVATDAPLEARTLAARGHPLQRTRNRPSLINTALPPTRTAVMAPSRLSASISSRLGLPITMPCCVTHRSVPLSRGVRAAR